MKRPSVESIAPRKYPIRIPTKTPMATVEIVTTSATKNEIRAPKSNRASKSCPMPGSRPNGCDQLIPLKPPSGYPWLFSRSLCRSRGSSPKSVRSSGANAVERIRIDATARVITPVLLERNLRHANSRGLRPTTPVADSNCTDELNATSLGIRITGR